MNARHTKLYLAVAVILLLLASHLPACTFAHGYFYQVTALKGRVIGADRSGTAFGWLKRSGAIAHSRLDLYEYRWPIHSQSEAPFVKAVETDAGGNFDFGSVGKGHYTLVVEGNHSGDEGWTGHDRFDIEVRDMPRATESLSIDVSSIAPDCSGGHKIYVYSKKPDR